MIEEYHTSQCKEPKEWVLNLRNYEGIRSGKTLGGSISDNLEIIRQPVLKNISIDSTILSKSDYHTN